jgi:hypothetical protein
MYTYIYVYIYIYIERTGGGGGVVEFTRHCYLQTVSYTEGSDQVEGSRP